LILSAVKKGKVNEKKRLLSLDIPVGVSKRHSPCAALRERDVAALRLRSQSKIVRQPSQKGDGGFALHSSLRDSNWFRRVAGEQANDLACVQ